MEWAEEIKLSIQKTASRKGRRSKSRDPSKNISPDKEISLDISVELDKNLTSTSSPTNSDTKRPPRRISGVWGEGGLKSFKLNKSKNKSVIEDERFKRLSPETVHNDDIPTIPDLDEIKTDNILNRAQIMSPKNPTVDGISPSKEIYSDLLTQKAFTGIEGVDLRILMRRLQPIESLEEPDEVWDWDKVFTDVVAEINSEKTNGKIEIFSNDMGSADI